MLPTPFSPLSIVNFLIFTTLCNTHLEPCLVNLPHPTHPPHTLQRYSLTTTEYDIAGGEFSDPIFTVLYSFHLIWIAVVSLQSPCIHFIYPTLILHIILFLCIAEPKYKLACPFHRLILFPGSSRHLLPLTSKSHTPSIFPGWPPCPPPLCMSKFLTLLSLSLSFFS